MLDPRTTKWSLWSLLVIALLACQAVMAGPAANTNITFSGQATLVNFTNNHMGPPTIIIGDTGPLPSTGGQIEVDVSETNLLNALTFNSGVAITTGFDN